MTGRLAGRVALVTGAARGIGRACAEGFLAEGAAVVAVDRQWEGAPALAPGAPGGGSVVQATLEVTDATALASIASLVSTRRGRLDVLVNNVGLRQKDLYPPSGAVTVLETTDEDWYAMLRVNVLGTLAVTRALVPLMIAGGGGSIVNVGSGDSPRYRNQPYAASKAALASMSRYLAEELRDANVAVNVLRPSGTMTTGSAEMAAANRAAGIPMGPLLRPEHVVPLALHLAEQDARSGTTGEVLEAVRWNEDHGFGPPAEWLAEAAGGAAPGR